MKRTEPSIEGYLGDLVEFSEPADALNLDAIKDAFQGGKTEFRIPAADTGAEVFFSNREILARFTAMAKPTQSAFLPG